MTKEKLVLPGKRPEIDKVILLVIDGMDTINFTLGKAEVMSGLHGRAAVGIARTEIIGAGTTITPTAHGMMGAGRNVTADRPGPDTDGRPYTYDGTIAVTVGDVARANGFVTGAVGKDEAAIALGGTGNLDISRLQKEGIDSTDEVQLIIEVRQVLSQFEKGILAVNFNAVDIAGHHRNVLGVIKAIERADRLVQQLIEAVDPERNLLIIAADHGTDPITGNHNTSPTPLSLITGAISGRHNLGIAHNMEIAPTILGALGLVRPEGMLGRDLLDLALSGRMPRTNYDPRFYEEYHD